MLKLSRHRLETDRLVLRAPVAGDARQLANIANVREIAEKLGTMPHPYGLADARKFIARVGDMPAGASIFAVCRAVEPDLLIGVCGYGPAHGLPDGAAPETDFGYWLGLEYWGRGYASEAARAVLTHAFCLSMVDQVTTDYQLTNPASGRVLEKLGFETIGRRRRHSLGTGGEVDTVNVRLTADRWLAAQRRPAA